MKDDNFVPENEPESVRMTNGQHKGMYRILTGMIREAQAEILPVGEYFSSLAVYHLADAINFLIDAKDHEFDWALFSCAVREIDLAYCMYNTPKIQLALNTAWEWFADIPIPFDTRPLDDINPIGTISWVNGGES